jgi:hypothetical protein
MKNNSAPFIFNNSELVPKAEVLGKLYNSIAEILMKTQTPLLVPAGPPHYKTPQGKEKKADREGDESAGLGPDRPPEV